MIFAGAATEGHLRLIEQRELVAVHRLAQLAHKRQALAAVLIEPIVPHGHAEILALRLVHSDVGASQERGALLAVFGEHRDAHARADVDEMSVEAHRRFEHLQHLARHVLGVHRRGAGQEHRELVAAEARHRVGRGSDHALQARGDLAQKHVTDRMPKRIVDVLEMIEIHEEHRDRQIERRGGRELLLEPFRVHGPVRQRGEAIPVREVHDARLARDEPLLHRAESVGKRADLVVASLLGKRRIVA